MSLKAYQMPKHCAVVCNTMRLDFTTQSQGKLYNYPVRVTQRRVMLHRIVVGALPGSTLLVRRPHIFSAVPTQWPHSGW